SRPEHTSLPYAPVGPAPLSSLFPYTTLFRSVEIGKLPEDGDDAAQPSTGSRDNSAGAPLGLSVETLAPETARSVGVEGGVVVAGVDRGPAFEAGIRARDIITEINRQQIRSVEDFRSVVRDLPEYRAVSVRIVRQGRAFY